MWPGPLGHRGVLAVLVALAVAMLLGHVCALPTLAHGVPAGAAHGEAPDDPHDADGSHVASCDATILKAPTCPDASELSGAVAVVLPAALVIVGRGVVPDLFAASRWAPDRPLFLLHASFLI